MAEVTRAILEGAAEREGEETAGPGKRGIGGVGERIVLEDAIGTDGGKGRRRSDEGKGTSVHELSRGRQMEIDDDRTRDIGVKEHMMEGRQSSSTHSHSYSNMKRYNDKEGMNNKQSKSNNQSKSKSQMKMKGNKQQQSLPTPVEMLMKGLYASTSLQCYSPHPDKYRNKISYTLHPQHFSLSPLATDEVNR